MSEVKKWYIGAYGGEAQARPCSPAEFEIIFASEGRYFVLAENYDSAVQCFLTASEGCVAAERRERALQQHLTVADERTDRLEGALRTSLLAMKRIYQAGYDRIVDAGGTCDTPEYMMAHDPTARELRALLDAKPETVAGHHPACRAVDDYKPGDCSHGCKPPAQPQGEPVAWRYRECEGVPWRLTDMPPSTWYFDPRQYEVRNLHERPAPAAMVPDGYCIMPRQLTAENGAKALLLGEFNLQVTMECPECCELEEPAEGCSICDGEGEYGQKHTIPWDQIKFIYSKAVSGLAVKAESAKSR